MQDDNNDEVQFAARTWKGKESFGFEVGRVREGERPFCDDWDAKCLTSISVVRTCQTAKREGLRICWIFAESNRV